MNDKFLTIRKTTVGFLLVILGSIVGFKYSVTGKLPFNIKLPFLNNGSRIKAIRRLVSTSDKSKDHDKINFDTFWEVWTLLEEQYLEKDKVDSEKMVEGAIAGMTQALEDPYTYYLPYDDNVRSAQDLAGSFYGVGIELGYKEKTLAVVSPLKGTPAEKAGIQPGDLIIHVKDELKDLDEDTYGWTLLEAVDKIRGQKGSEIIFTVFRDNNGDKPFEISITRDEILVDSVDLLFIEQDNKRIAHLSLSRFGERTKDEWDVAVKDILKQKTNLAGIVLDMRNNPGGFLDKSIEIASDFIKDGVIVTQEGEYISHEYKSDHSGRLNGIPVVVLVNKGSASASEIVAGAMRDRLGTKLIGEKTFGKGTVQERIPLSDGSGIHITVARWVLPGGDWIHEEGIDVDVEVKQDYETEEDEVLNKSIEELLS